MAFRKLGIIEPILKSIEEHKFEKPSEIQEKAIPLVLAGKDIIAGSATGSGKTLVFGAGIIHTSERGKGIQALVLVPTRELAEQVATALKNFSKYKPLSIVSVYGGVSINPQMDLLKRADVVVGTPGRILDHMERRTINLSRVRTLVLDEADRMLDMGFIEDVEKIIRMCQRERQTMMFSATIAPELSRIAQKYMKEPVKVSAVSYVDPSKLPQFYYDVQQNSKISLLIHLLKQEHAGLAMIFCNTRHVVDFVSNNLKHAGIEAIAIHGGFSQAQRNRVIEMFHSQEASVLVCTDVAARGLDIKGVSHIYNYDIPKDSKEYIHRIGRTARAGKEGKVINILAKLDHENFQRVLRDFKITVNKIETPEFAHVQVRMQEQRGFRGGFNRGFRGRSEDRPRRDEHWGHRNRFGSSSQGGNRGGGQHRSWGRR